jgi:hypothetical protein
MSWPYSPPNVDGTCPNPDTHMLIRNTAPGTCFLNSLWHRSPPYGCIQPDPLDSSADHGFVKQTNKDYAICAPACSSQADCPPIGADPRSGKALQGLPNCTVMRPPASRDFTAQGHCVISPPIFTQYTFDPVLPNQHFDECNEIGGDETTKNECDIWADVLHRTPADNFLHINNPVTCQKNYDNFLNTNTFGQKTKSALAGLPDKYAKWLLNSTNWCTVNPVFPQGSVTAEAVSCLTYGAMGQCDVKQGTLPSSCKDVDCTSESLRYNELDCRNTHKDCCKWNLHLDPMDNSNFGTAYFPINKPTPPPPPPPPSVERFKC